MKPHQIRLVGPWEWRPVNADGGNLSEAALTRCRLPFAVAGESPAGAVRLHRGFHRPTGIHERTRIYAMLEVGGVAVSAGPDCHAAFIAVSLNGQALPAENSQLQCGTGNTLQPGTVQLRFDVSNHLKPFNDLQVVLVSDSEHRISLNAACLEIHDEGCSFQAALQDFGEPGHP